MNYFEQLEERYYGSIELKKRVGPNLLRGLIVSTILHTLAIGIPLIILLLQDKTAPPKAPVRVIDISQLTKIKNEIEPLKLAHLPGGGGGGGGGGGAKAPQGVNQTAPVAIFHAPVTLVPYDLAAGDVEVPEDPGLIDPLLRQPAFGIVHDKGIPVPTDLPDYEASRSATGLSLPQSGIPSPQSHGGNVPRGVGNIDAPDIALLPVGGMGSTGGLGGGLPGDYDYGGMGSGRGTGIGEGSGSGSGGGSGSGHGSGSGPGHGPGQGSGSGGGIGSGIGTGEGSGIGEGRGDGIPAPKAGVGSPVVSSDELSGLIAWLRKQRAQFPGVVKQYLETDGGDLCGVTDYEGWDIFIQFNEQEHQLKIFLSRDGTGILLADSDFRQRSQLFAQGMVSRDALHSIAAIEATREKPGLEKTGEFYRVFGHWMDAQNIRMGSRGAK